MVTLFASVVLSFQMLTNCTAREVEAAGLATMSVVVAVEMDVLSRPTVTAPLARSAKAEWTRTSPACAVTSRSLSDVELSRIIRRSC
jgi:hypothetical protein